MTETQPKVTTTDAGAPAPSDDRWLTVTLQRQALAHA
jgi:hypothetical protein